MKRFKLVSKEKPKPKQEKLRKKSAVTKFQDSILQQINLCKGRYKKRRKQPVGSWIEDWSAYDRGYVLVPKSELDGRQIPFWVALKTGKAKGIPVDMDQPHPGLAELERLLEMVAAGRYRTPIYNRLREERKKSVRKIKS